MGATAGTTRPEEKIREIWNEAPTSLLSGHEPLSTGVVRSGRLGILPHSKSEWEKEGGWFSYGLHFAVYLKQLGGKIRQEIDK